MQAILDERAIPTGNPPRSRSSDGAIRPSEPIPGVFGDRPCPLRELGKPDSPPGPLLLPYLGDEYEVESAKTESALQNFDKRPAESGRRRPNPDTSRLHGGGL